MGCSYSAPKQSLKEKDMTGADENNPAVPSHGANELPPMIHEDEFEPYQQVAWIIDDAVAKTKPLPKRKTVIELPEQLGDSTDELS